MKLIRLSDKPLLEPRITEASLLDPHMNINNLIYWWELRSVFNPGAILKKNSFHLLYRAQDFHFISRFGSAVYDPRLNKITKRSDLPAFELSSPNELQFGRIGCEDPRIIYLKDEGEYYVTYVSASVKQINRHNLNQLRKSAPYGWYDVFTRVIVSEDLSDFKDCGLIFHKKSLKDVALFPKKLNGYYIFLVRFPPSIQIAFSRNLVDIEHVTELINPREGYWDNDKVGVGPAPIFTPKGWLCIYHGVDKKRYYRLGYFVLDLKDPTKVIYRCEEPILEPERPWERIGNVPDVVFSNGADIYKDEVYVFYGAADTRIGVAKGKLSGFFPG